AACRDESHTLRRFDVRAVAARAAAPSPPRRSLLSAVGRIVWHPAFAYAVALVVGLYPLLTGRTTSLRLGKRHEPTSAVALSTKPAPKMDQALEAPDHPAKGATRPVPEEPTFAKSARGADETPPLPAGRAPAASAPAASPEPQARAKGSPES